MRVLITGIEGFVAPYLAKEVMQQGNQLFGTYLLEPSKISGIEYVPMDLLDVLCVSNSIEKIKPEIIYHLAGFSSVAESWKKPELAMQINAGGTRNLLESVMRAGIMPRILVVSSAEIYGRPKYLPMDESHPVESLNPYGASRIEQEKIISDYPSLDIIVARSFNHTGPNQPPNFVCPAFAKQIADIEKGIIPPVIMHGNLDPERDFSDVRDIVKAYAMLAEKGKSHEIYNVCSGNAYKIKDMLNILLSSSKVQIETKEDPAKMRHVDVPALVGNNSKLCAETGWKPQFPIGQTLIDLLNSYRA